MITQPVRPATVEQAAAALAAGELVDLAGRPLVSRPCPHCPGVTLGETCPRSLPCTHCRARPGAPCPRPSGHVLSDHFGGTHRARIRAADARDRDREAAGDLTLPAPWPAVDRSGQLALDLA